MLQVFKHNACLVFLRPIYYCCCCWWWWCIHIDLSYWTIWSAPFLAILQASGKEVHTHLSTVSFLPSCSPHAPTPVPPLLSPPPQKLISVQCSQAFGVTITKRITFFSHHYNMSGRNIKIISSCVDELYLKELDVIPPLHNGVIRRRRIRGASCVVAYVWILGNKKPFQAERVEFFFQNTSHSERQAECRVVCLNKKKSTCLGIIYFLFWNDFRTPKTLHYLYCNPFRGREVMLQNPKGGFIQFFINYNSVNIKRLCVKVLVQENVLEMSGKASARSQPCRWN